MAYSVEFNAFRHSDRNWNAYGHGDGRQTMTTTLIRDSFVLTVSAAAVVLTLADFTVPSGQ